MSITLKPILGCNFGCKGCYEGEIFRSNGNNPESYDLNAIILKLLNTKKGDSVTLHGGEILLMPLRDLRVILEACQAQGRAVNMQTNASMISAEHIELFKEFGVSIGVSINGPDILNRDRLAVPFTHDDLRHGQDVYKITDQMTAKIHENLYKMREAGLSVSLITVLSKTNAGTDELLDRLIRWAIELGEKHNIWHFRFNPLHEDLDSFGVELTPEQAAHAYVRMAEATLQDHRRLWLPFREFVDNLWGLGRGPCWVNECDVYATNAVYAVFGDGSTGNCLRTAKDGVSYSRASEQGTDMRGQILKQIPMADGGCGGCRYWRVCTGGCPAEAVNSDWRNKSRFCQMYIDTYEFLEHKLKGLIPNFTPVPDWTTNDEAEMIRRIECRQHELTAINPLRPEWSRRASTFAQDAKQPK